ALSTLSLHDALPILTPRHHWGNTRKLMINLSVVPIRREVWQIADRIFSRGMRLVDIAPWVFGWTSGGGPSRTSVTMPCRGRKRRSEEHTSELQSRRE